MKKITLHLKVSELKDSSFFKMPSAFVTLVVSLFIPFFLSLAKCLKKIERIVKENLLFIYLRDVTIVGSFLILSASTTSVASR